MNNSYYGKNYTAGSSALKGTGSGPTSASRPTGNYYPTSTSNNHTNATNANAMATTTAATPFPAYNPYGNNDMNNSVPVPAAPNPYGASIDNNRLSSTAATATATGADHDDWFSSAQKQDAAPDAGSVNGTSINSNESFRQPANINTNSSFMNPYATMQQPARSESMEMLSEPIHGNMNAFSGQMSATSTPTASSFSEYQCEDYANDPPLLEELGINIDHIKTKSLAVILPVKYAKAVIDTSIMEDNDLAGPLAFGLLLATELLLAGKIHFGYIYGFGLFGCLATTLVLNLMSPSDSISVWTVVSILGYSLLPVNMLAAMNVFYRIKHMGGIGVILAALTICWCTFSSTRLFERGCGMRDQRYLIGYPNALLYSAFVMLTIF